jgi:molybdopterin molybdotransferase
MPEFLELLPPDQALQKLLAHPIPRLSEEVVDTSQALGRVTAQPIFAPHPLPSFSRSSVDGYALRAADTFGASESLPAYLRLGAEAEMGAEVDFSIHPGECSLIHTGGMLPREADAVIMVEHTQTARGDAVEILRSVAPGENVLLVGEDVSAGQEVISSGVRLRPAEIGGLMALGLTRLPVVRRPLVGLVSSGDEVISPELPLSPGKVRDVNSYSLGALIEKHGGISKRYGISADRIDMLRALVADALLESDMVVITAGSSVSARDLTAQVIDELGSPGVLVHGVNVRPGKPTILALCKDKPVIGLPGNPVSALVIAGLFVVPLLEILQGLSRKAPPPAVIAKLSLNLSSQAGREDWVPVRLLPASNGWQAESIFGKSNLIFTLARADGLIRIPPAANGLSAGESVEVILI